MTPLFLILNGKSAGRDDVRSAIQAARDEGIHIDVRVTWETHDAARYAEEGARLADRVIVAGGGDGTVNEVLCGLLDSHRDSTLGLLPLGTANDFATSAGIPVGDLLASLRLAATSTARKVDVGMMNGRPFMNVASGGFGAQVTVDTPPALKKAIGGSAYALTALLMAMRAQPYHGRLVADDLSHEGSMIMMAVGNARQAGGGALVTPHAVIDDSLLDLMLIPDYGHDRFAHLLADLAATKHGESEHARYSRARKLLIESEEELQINADGEPMRGKRFAFEVLSGALRLVLPEQGSPLLGNPASA